MSFTPKEKEPLQIYELQRQFQIQQFISVVDELLCSLCLQTKLNLEEIFQQIKNKNNKVIGKDILRIMNILQKEAEIQEQLDREISFYKSTIENLINKGKIILTIGEFFVIFALNNPHKGIVTDQIQEQISEYKVISVQKVYVLIEQIEKSKRMNQTFQKVKKKESSQIDFGETIRQFEQIHNLKQYLEQNISNPVVVQSIFRYFENHLLQLEDSQQKINQQQSLINHYQRNNKIVNDQIMRLEAQIELKTQIIQKLQERNDMFEKQIQIFEKKCQQDFIQTISKLREQNSKIAKERNQILQSFQSLSKSKQIIENQSPVNSIGVQQGLKYQFSEQKYDITDTLKQQLKEAYEKINKMRKSYTELQRKISDLQSQIEAKNVYAGLNYQTDKTFHDLAFDQRIVEKDDHKQIFLDLLRKNQFDNETNEFLTQKIALQRCKSVRMVRSITKQYFDSEAKLNNLSTHETKSRNFQINTDSNIKNIRQHLSQYDFSGFFDSKFFREFTKLVIDLGSKKPINPIFSSQIYAIGPSGPLLKFVFVLTADKLLLLKPSKDQIYKQWNTSDILQFCICQNMRTWVVMRINQLQNRNTEDLVIQLKNRDQFIQFIYKNGFMFPQKQIQLKFKRQQDITINQKSSSFYLSTFKGVKQSNNSIMISNQNCFDVEIKEYFIFFPKLTKAQIVISSVGIIVLEKARQRFWKLPNFFGLKQKLKYVLPFCQNMEIIDLSKEKSIKILYPQINKSIIMTTQSYAEAKLIFSRIGRQRRTLIDENKRHFKKNQSLFLALKKMRSLQDQVISNIFDY